MKPNQCHAAVLLASGQSQADVAALLNVHPETIRNWLKKGDFRAMLASETQIAREKLRNSNCQAFVDEIKRLKNSAQNRARTSTHDEKARIPAKNREIAHRKKFARVGERICE
jgi:hypothetical protein